MGLACCGLNSVTRNTIRMRSFLLLSAYITTISAQGGLLNGLSNLLTNVVGGGATGEVDGYENAPYQVINRYDVRYLHLNVDETVD